MPRSLLKVLPKTAAKGRWVAQYILKCIGNGARIGLQANAFALPSKDMSGLWRRQVSSSSHYREGINRLIDGNNLFAWQVLPVKVRL